MKRPQRNGSRVGWIPARRMHTCLVVVCDRKEMATRALSTLTRARSRCRPADGRTHCIDRTWRKWSAGCGNSTRHLKSRWRRLQMKPWSTKPA